MSVILGILLTILVFFVVVMIHEWGHFITARITGMKVLEFGFWIPPKIKKIFTDKKGTNYTLNALPFGGFVRIDGEDFSKPSAFQDGAFMSKSLPKRLLVLVAGVAMNLVLAWCIFVGLFIVGVKPLSVIPLDIGKTNSYFLPSFEEWLESGFVQHSGIRIDPIADSIAEKSGLWSGDVIVSVNQKNIRTIDDLTQEIQKNQMLSVEILRNHEKKLIEIMPENGKIWVAISYENLKMNSDFSPKFSFSEAIIMGTKEVYHSSILTFILVKKTLGNFFFPNNPEEHETAKKNLAGPIGAGNAFVMMVEHAVPVTIILLFTALLSINLAVMNILPFPALDGGRIVLTTIYSIGTKLGFSREKILRIESIINTLGFAVLLLFMFYVLGLDIFRLLP